MEIEAKRMRRDVAAMEKEVIAMRTEKDHENRVKRLGNSKSSLNSSQLLPGRYTSSLQFSANYSLLVRFLF